MAGLERFHYHAADASPEERERRPALRGMRTILPNAITASEDTFSSDEDAARAHLSEILGEDDRPPMRGIAAPERAEAVPDLQLVDVQEFPETATRLVRFEQTQSKIPVFGGHAVIELDDSRALVSARGEVADVQGVDATASLSPADAVARVAKFVGKDASDLGDIDPPQLNFYLDKDEQWRLVWVLSNVAAAPDEVVKEAHGHGLKGPSPRLHDPRMDYLVDAHDGEVVFYYSAMPMLNVGLPTYGKGHGEDDQQVQLLGQMVGNEFELTDPMHQVVTYDLDYGDFEQANLTEPVRFSGTDLGDQRKAVVSAHYNATRVDEFFRSALQRSGIDNKGMQLINVVNTCYPRQQPGPSWDNAVWWGGRMWYGQSSDGNGGLRSYARFLDVMAHELSHGITEHTSKLIYKDESGALNESFSDIIGIIVKNWDPTRPQDGGDVANWDWELGSGLGQNGGPLRDLSDPSRTGDPDHTKNRVTGPRDNGGVHTNSNIHNKAAYNVLTATDSAGARAFTPKEGALLFYLGFIRLGQLSGFGDVLGAVVDVAQSLWMGDPQVRDGKVAAIRDAYAEVGITASP